MNKLRRDDEVIIITGKDKGKRGTISRLVGKDRVLVHGVNMVKPGRSHADAAKLRDPARERRGERNHVRAPLLGPNAAAAPLGGVA